MEPGVSVRWAIELRRVLFSIGQVELGEPPLTALGTHHDEGLHTPLANLLKLWGEEARYALLLGILVRTAEDVTTCSVEVWEYRVFLLG